VTPQFRRAGDLVVLLGEAVPGLAGSAYAELAGAAIDERLPSLDLAREAALQRLLLAAAKSGILASAQDVSGGGLAVALAECSIWGGVGARLSLRVSAEPAVELFGESPSRALVSLRPADLATLAALAAEHGVPLEPLGEVGGDRLAIELVGGGAAGAAEERGASVADALDCTLAVLRHAWEQALPGALGDDAFVPPRER
jgi:phosphoribosylformylglycinamidine synthase